MMKKRIAVRALLAAASLALSLTAGCAREGTPSSAPLPGMTELLSRSLLPFSNPAAMTVTSISSCMSSLMDAPSIMIAFLSASSSI